jgi:hypothetical protein
MPPNGIQLTNHDLKIAAACCSKLSFSLIND